MKNLKSIEINRQEKEINELQLSLEVYRTMYIKLNNIVVKAIAYIEEKYDYILKDETFLDHDEIIDRKQMLELIKILQGKDN